MPAYLERYFQVLLEEQFDFHSLFSRLSLTYVEATFWLTLAVGKSWNGGPLYYFQ